MRTFLIISTVVTFVFSPIVWAQQPQAPAIPVVLDSVQETEVVATMPITGNVYSQNDVQITAAISGQLTHVTEPGTQVKTGDVIATMDTAALSLQQAEQKALITRAQAQLNYLNTNLKRQQNLVKANTVSANTVEQTSSQRDVAASDLTVAQIRLKQIEEQLSRSIIKAPFDGVVSARLRRIGETVAAGTPLAAMMDMGQLEIRAQVPIRYVNHMQVGQSLAIHAFGVQQQGRIKSLVPSNQSQSQAYELRLAFDNQHRLAIGQLVSVAVPMKAAAQSLIVNQDALVLRENGTFVFKVNEDNTVEQVAVQANENVGDSIAIKAELKAGDQVVVRGADGLRPGAVVAIQKG